VVTAVPPEVDWLGTADQVDDEVDVDAAELEDALGVDELATVDVAVEAVAARRAIPPLSPRNVITLKAAAITRDRAAARRRRGFVLGRPGRPDPPPVDRSLVCITLSSLHLVPTGAHPASGA
jgi:hypothetical protein